jgi:uncharacterized protein YndB with AHSA1/START domain
MSSDDLGQILDANTIRLERTLPGPVERVWAFLTDGDKRRRWLATGELELRSGAAIDLQFDHRNLSHEEETPAKHREVDGAHLLGRVVACEPPRLLVITWTDQGHESEVTFQLTPKGDDVTLRLTHRRLRNEETLTSAAAGWHAHLGILEDALAERRPRGFWSTHAALESQYAGRMRTMNDYFRWGAGVQREVRGDGQQFSSVLRRRLDASPERVWAAWTDPEQLARWLGKPSGELAVGGTVILDLQMPQKTTVNVLACEPPRRLRTTWRYGDWRPSEAELRLAPDGAGTLLELEHYMAPSRDDARGTGSGWEVAILHLDHWLRGLPRPTDVMHPAADQVWTTV